MPYMHEVIQANDAAFIAYSLGVVARARGMAKVAKKSGLSRESLYKALSWMAIHNLRRSSM